jgi:hypothetical protein
LLRAKAQQARPAKLPALLTLLTPHLSMKRYWLLFSQTVTILLAAYFVVATLKPQWLN